MSPGAGHHHPTPRPGPAEAASCPLLRLVKDPNRPAQAAGRAEWPVARPSCRPCLARGGTQGNRPPRKADSPAPDSVPGRFTARPRRRRKAGGGFRSFSGLENCSRTPLGAPSDPVGGCLNSRVRGLREPHRHRRQREREPTAGQAKGGGANRRQAPTQRNGKRAEGDKERKADPEDEGSGNRKTETARPGEQALRRERRHQRPERRGSRRGLGQSRGGTPRAPAAELGRCPGAGRPGPPPAARLPLGCAPPRSAADLRPSEGKTEGRGDRLRRPGVP